MNVSVTLKETIIECEGAEIEVSCDKSAMTELARLFEFIENGGRPSLSVTFTGPVGLFGHASYTINAEDLKETP